MRVLLETLNNECIHLLDKTRRFLTHPTMGKFAVLQQQRIQLEGKRCARQEQSAERAGADVRC